MSEICQTCGFLYCDGHDQPQPSQPPPKELIKPKRQISDVRLIEIQHLISDIKRGDISHDEAMRAYNELKESMRRELVLIRELSAALLPQIANSKPALTFDDFPLKNK